MEWWATLRLLSNTGQIESMRWKRIMLGAVCSLLVVLQFLSLILSNCKTLLMKYVEGIKNVTVYLCYFLCFPSLILLPSFPLERALARILYFAFLYNFIHICSLILHVFLLYHVEFFFLWNFIISSFMTFSVLSSSDLWVFFLVDIFHWFSLPNIFYSIDIQ